MSYNLNKKHLEIARVLVEKIKDGQIVNMEQTITYSELGVKVRLPISTFEEREIFGNYLGQLSSYCYKNKMPLISAMVVRKPEKYDTNKKYNNNNNNIDIRGSGFYNLYEDLRGIRAKGKDEKAIVFYKELELIKEYKDWDRLIEQLEEEINKTTIRERLNKRKPKRLGLVEVDVLNDKEVDHTEIDEFINIEHIEIEEGEHIQRVINARKRNSNARKLKLEKFKKDNYGRVFCEVCKENDIAVIDIHHNSIDVAKMEEGHKTKLSDLRVLCSNCHRKAHYYEKDVEDLIKEYNKKCNF